MCDCSTCCSCYDSCCHHHHKHTHTHSLCADLCSHHKIHKYCTYYCYCRCYHRHRCCYTCWKPRCLLQEVKGYQLQVLKINQRKQIFTFTTSLNSKCAVFPQFLQYCIAINTETNFSFEFCLFHKKTNLKMFLSGFELEHLDYWLFLAKN